MYTKEQIALQTLCANGLVPTWRMSFAQSIATANCASSKQLFHVQKILDEIVNAPVLPKISSQKIFDLFNSAIKHLKYPKINLRTSSGTNIRFSVSQKNTSVIHMNQSGYGSPYFGKLWQNGDVELYRDGKTIQVELLTLLEEFAKDPAGVSAKYGKMTRNCCYCSKTLDTPESLAVGYGPVCAKHFGLPWGKVIVATANNVITSPAGWQHVVSQVVATEIASRCGIANQLTKEEISDHDDWIDEVAH